MKSTPTLRFSIKRLFLLTLVSLVAVAALIGVAASANKANRAAKALQAQEAQAAASKLATSKNSIAPQPLTPLAPLAPGITATLTDNVTPNTTKVAPGATVNYTAVISDAGVSPADDALNAFYNDVLDSNTTVVAGSVHASPIAFTDTYNWVGNTQLDTTARALPAVTANDIAVNATSPAVGTDTFNLVTQTNAPTTLAGGLVTVNANGSFVYTPPVGRPNAGDGGVTVTDSFTYTITNSADATLVGTGTVNIVLTGRVWYLQAGAAGDGRSNTPSGSPSAMSTAANLNSDIFYVFSNAGNLDGPFSLDNSQQLLGQGVALVINIPVLGSTTLFPASTLPTLIDTTAATNGVTLGNGNTVRGFNIGNCTGAAILGTNVGALALNTMTINTTGAGLDLTGVAAPVAISLSGVTSTSGAKNVNLVGLNGTVGLGNGALSGASGNAFDVSGAGNAIITYSGTIANTTARSVSVVNKNAGSVNLSGAVSGSNLGIVLTGNTGSVISFTGALSLSTGANAAFTATGGGTVSSTNTTSTLTTTTATALNVANTTIGASGLTFLSINAPTASGNPGIVLNNTGSGALNVTGTSTTAGTGGTISNKTGNGVDLRTANNITLKNMNLTNNAQTNGEANPTLCGATGLNGQNVNCTADVYLGTVSGITLDNVNINGSNQNGINGLNVVDLKIQNGSIVQNCGNESGESGVFIQNLTGLNNALTGSTFSNNRDWQFAVADFTSGALGNAGNPFNVSGCTFTGKGNTTTSEDGFFALIRGTTTANINIGGGANTPSHFKSNFSYGVFTTTADTASATLTVNGCDFGTGGSTTYNNSGIGIGISGGSTLNYTISNNTITGVAFGTPGNGVGIIASTGLTTAGASIIGTISGNTIGETAVSGSGGFNNAAAMQLLANGGGDMVYKATVTGNHIHNPTALGIQYIGGTTTGAVTGTLHITGNDISTDNVGPPVGAPAGQAIAVAAAASGVGGSVSTLCADISGNTMTGTWDGANTDRIRVTTLRGSIYTVGGMPGSGAQTAAAVATFVGSQNGAAPPLTSSSNTASGGGTFNANSGAACPLLLAEGGVMAVLNGPSLLSTFLNSALDSSAPARLEVPSSSSLATASLDQSQLNSVVAAAIDRWTTTGLTRNQLAILRRINFEVADLGDTYLGEAADGVRIDRNAGGKGWYTGSDSTSDSLFSHSTSATRRYTDPTSAAAGHIDLLTAIEHEIGHKLGLDDTYSASDRDNLMHGFLTVGERRLPAPGQAGRASHNSSAHIPSPPSPVASVSRPTQPATRERQAEVERYTAPTAPVKTIAIKPVVDKSRDVRRNHAARSNAKSFSSAPNMVLAGETINVPFGAGGAVGTLPAGKSITIKYAATINVPPLVRQVSTQGVVSGTNFATVQTDDPDAAGSPNPTITLIDTLATWNGGTSTNWSTAANWTVPGGTPYAPGIANSAVNDVVIPFLVPNDPTLSANADVFSLTMNNTGASTHTLTITGGNTLTIDGAAAGSDLNITGTIPNVIAGGALNFAGAGPHAINNTNTGGSSLSPTNVATVLSPAVVTLNNNLNMGTLAVNSGGTMNITNRSIGLQGAGAALTVAGTLTTTGSTVQFQGGAPQTTNAPSFVNLTIFNGSGVTLTANASVSGILNTLSGDLNTGALTLTQPGTTASQGTGDVVGTVKRTGSPNLSGAPLTFGNPNNRITFLGGTTPTDMSVTLAKTAPATFATAVLRTYTVATTGGSGSTATFRLRYIDPGDLNGNSEPALNLRRLRTADSHWVAQLPDAVDTTNNFVEATSVPAANLPTQWTFSSQAPTASGGAITGRIVDDSGRPVEGAVVRLGGAQNRKFITDANGFYRFDNVETNGFYTVTPSRVNYSFNPSVRSFSQLGESTEATFGATLATSTHVNPLDTPEYFVRQHYLDFLGREPDEAGFNFWSDQILGCGNDGDCISRKRENVSAAYFLSIEFQKTGGLVDGVYRASYGARPDFAQFMPDTRTVGEGVIVNMEGWEARLNANKEAFATAFVNRAAFHALYDGMDNSLFVDTLIGHTGVSFTSGERDALVGGLTTGTMSRAEALRSIAENNRFATAKFNEAFVMMEYFGYLRRNADAGGFQFWLDKLNQFGGNFEQAEMVKAFIVSGEYRDRFPR